jgi:bifunctional DNA-binding transcriptional regulator/antitoxin component of YhaV-PrlF toxin-antitoxin module
MEKYDKMLEELDSRRTMRIRRCSEAQGITLPKKFLKALDWDLGDPIIVRVDKSAGTITLEKPTYAKNP